MHTYFLITGRCQLFSCPKFEQNFPYEELKPEDVLTTQPHS